MQTNGKNKKTIGVAITGSFCTHAKILEEIKKLIAEGYSVLPILSNNVAEMDTRFGRAQDLKENLLAITGNAPVTTLQEAEPLGPQNKIDILVIAPCTGNTLGKLANAITDTSVTMAAKAHMRNNKPLIIAVSTNDGLGLNLVNIGKLITVKNIYFVPFRQDDAQNKPKSLVADYDLISDSIHACEMGQQLQPIIR